VVVKPYAFPVVVFNKKQGIFTDLKMRQAVQAATSFQPMLQAAFGDPSFYRLDPSLFFKETKWWSDAGKALYNQNNPDKAKQLLQAAGYHGQTIRVLTTQQYDYMYKLATVLKSQLEAIGMHVTLDVVDWATVVQRRNDPTAYDIFITGFGVLLDPATSPFWDATWPGWWVDPQKDTLLQQLAIEPDYNKRMELEAQFQQLWYEDVPMLKVGDDFFLEIKSKKLYGAGLSSPLLYLFNCWLSR
jgi:peptide/nickel transport system substrate-binding protein